METKVVSALLELEGVSLRLGGATILEGLSLAVEQGEMLALLGPSGCGKSSALRMLLGFATPERGSVRLGGETVATSGRLLKPPEERRLAMVFQDLALWPHLTVRGNLAFGLDCHGFLPRERDDRIAAILDRVGLAGKERRYPAQLSGGERQRVAIARALVLDPLAVLLDEPLSSLDVGLKRELRALFRELIHAQRQTAVYVTHDPREAAALGDRIAVMEQGRVVQSGTLRELREKPGSEFVRSVLAEI